jgi:hypothetical protein
VQRWGSQSQHVILAGDWNASLHPRIGYSGLAPTVRADARLHAWSVSAGFACEAPAEPTWASADDSRRALLDCFFWKSVSGQPSVSHAEAFSAQIRPWITAASRCFCVTIVSARCHR